MYLEAVQRYLLPLSFSHLLLFRPAMSLEVALPRLQRGLALEVRR